MTAQSEEGTCVRSAGNMMQATGTGGGAAAAADDTITAIRRRWLHLESTANFFFSPFPPLYRDIVTLLCMVLQLYINILNTR